MRAILIDDEPNGLRTLELLLTKYCPGVKVVASIRSPLNAIELIDNYHPDVVFLDINMPKLNGFELLEKISFRNFQLIFTTAFEEYALKAIKQSAVDYLLKPIISEELKAAVHKAEKRIKENELVPDAFRLLKELKESQSLRINIPVKTGIEVIDIFRIVFIESKANRTEVILSDGVSLSSTKALKEYETILCKNNSRFIRIQNSFIVNVDYVKAYAKGNASYIVMRNGKKITISRHKKSEFLNAVNAFER